MPITTFWPVVRGWDRPRPRLVGSEGLGLTCPPRARVSGDRLRGRVHGRGHRPVAVARLDLGGEDLANDSPGGDVGKRAFEAVAHLEARLVVVGENEEHEAVVLSPPAHAPGLEGLHGEVLDGHVPGGAADPDQELVAGLLLVGLEARVEALTGGSGQEVRAVRHPARGRRRHVFRREQGLCGEEPRGRGHEGRGLPGEAADHRSRARSRT